MTKAEIVSFVKDVRIEQDKRNAAKFVAKETGKGLSTNDYTTAEKSSVTLHPVGITINCYKSLNAVAASGFYNIKSR